MKKRVVAGWMLGCVAGGMLTVPYLWAKSAPSVAHSQSEFDQLAKSAGTNINVLGHAYDNQSARLFWFTDLEAAKKQAAKEGKPILSLRMLGNLSDEYSCANSRFFRTALYPNATINKLLREKFVLHWSSERPVPVVTIDMGDGRVLKRTLTGNSAHYLMNSNGAVLDVLPGMYAPATFATWLQSGDQLAGDLAKLTSSKREETLKEWHETQLKQNLLLQSKVDQFLFGPVPESLSPQQEKGITDTAERRFDVALKSGWGVKPLKLTTKPPVGLILPSSDPTDSNFRFTVTAEEASALAIGKTVAEFSLLKNSAPRPTDSPLISSQERQRWGRLASTYVEAAHLDNNSRALLKTKLPASKTNKEAQVRTVGSSWGTSITLTPSDLTIARFEDAIAFDTARNEMDFHNKIHAIFARGEQGDFATLNRNIYDKLFLTPASDPWLGLLPDGVYNGLENGGITVKNEADKTASVE